MLGREHWCSLVSVMHLFTSTNTGLFPNNVFVLRRVYCRTLLEQTDDTGSEGYNSHLLSGVLGLRGRDGTKVASRKRCGTPL